MPGWWETESPEREKPTNFQLPYPRGVTGSKGRKEWDHIQEDGGSGIPLPTAPGAESQPDRRKKFSCGDGGDR